ncbi:hypothetical protein [Gelidibacter japonicus]|uniref:hypothetical protein n=1 Tax=Gelidibacter japonicus TaxID=1962232 RepID=UPI003A8CF050
MKKALIISILFFVIKANGQNLFFIGEKSYPCTESISLQSNKEEGKDLNVLFAKDNSKAYFVVNTKPSLNSEFSGKLIIYLDDGTVITCNDISEYDYVDNIAKAVYALTKEQLNKMRNSNLNTVRYTLNVLGVKEVNHSASNKGSSTKTNFPDLISEFFK